MTSTALRSAITAQVLVDLERHAANSLTDPRIADALNVPLATLEGWISVGTSDPTSLEGKAVEALRRGRTSSVTRLTGVLVEAATDGTGGVNDEGKPLAKKEWRAAAFLLERVHGYVHPRDIPEDAEATDTIAQMSLALAEKATQ